MSDNFDFYKELMKLKKKAEKVWVKPLPNKVELTLKQKQIVVDYMLGGSVFAVGKGLFEDCEEFWESVDDINGFYPAYRDAIDDFVEALREKILKELS